MQVSLRRREPEHEKGERETSSLKIVLLGGSSDAVDFGILVNSCRTKAFTAES